MTATSTWVSGASRRLSGAVAVRDELVCVESDVEVFIDGGDTYYELQLNARNTVYEVFYIWKDAYVRGGRFDVAEFDVRHAFTFAGNPDHDHTANRFWTGTHPRGNRWSFSTGTSRACKQLSMSEAPSMTRPWRMRDGPLRLRSRGMAWLGSRTASPSLRTQATRGASRYARYEKLRIGGNDVFAGWLSTRIGSVDNHRPERFMEAILSDHLVEQLTSDASTQRW